MPMLEWMPITRPSRSNSGPPESPEMTVASVIEELGALAGIEDASQADGRRAALLDAAGMAQGHAPRARLDVGGMAHLDVRPLAGLGDLGKARIAREVRPQGLGRGAAAIGEDHRQFAARLGDDVADGEDQAVFAHHDAAALAQAAARRPATG